MAKWSSSVYTDCLPNLNLAQRFDLRLVVSFPWVLWFHPQLIDCLSGLILHFPNSKIDRFHFPNSEIDRLHFPNSEIDNSVVETVMSSRREGKKLCSKCDG